MRTTDNQEKNANEYFEITVVARASCRTVPEIDSGGDSPALEIMS